MKSFLIVVMTLMVVFACRSEWDGYAFYVASNCHFQSWCGTTQTNYPHAIVDWSVPIMNLPTNGIQNVSWQSSAIEHLSELFLYAGTNDDIILRISGTVCTNVMAAHVSIIDRLSIMTTTVLHQLATNGIGDVCLIYPLSDDNFSTVTFARNNVMVSVSSYVPEIAATNVAIQLDENILEKCK